VQFGTQSGSERNSRALQELLGWRGLLMDGKYNKPAINLHKEFVTPVNDHLMWFHNGTCNVQATASGAADVHGEAAYHCMPACLPARQLPACRQTSLRACPPSLQENVNHLFEKYDVPGHFDLLSIGGRRGDAESAEAVRAGLGRMGLGCSLEA
jgi:hypothetical protein